MEVFMPNGIGRVWVANSGDEGRPNGVGPVWIENISALGPGGGGDIPSDVSGKWEDASDCVESNSASWNDAIKKNVGVKQTINMGGNNHIDFGLSDTSNVPGVSVNDTTLGSDYLNVRYINGVANQDNNVNIDGSNISIALKNNRTNVSSKLTNTTLTFNSGADTESLNLYDISALKASSGGGGASLPLTGSSNNTTASYDSNSAQFEYSESEGEPTHNFITVDPQEPTIEIKNSSDGDESWSRTIIEPDNITFIGYEGTEGSFNADSVTSWDSTWSTVESNSANWAGGNFSGVTVSNSLTGDGKNTPLGLNTPIVAQNNEATGTFSQYGNSFRNGDAYAEYSASNINLKVTGGSPYISAVSYDNNNDFLGSVSLNSTGVVFKDSMGGVTQFGSAAVDSWVDTRSTVQSNSASWGQGTTYGAGNGILINNNEISVDTMTIPDYNTVTGMIDTATGNIPTPVNADWSATTGLAQILNKPQTEEVIVSGIDAGSGISITTGTSAYSINCTYGEDINYISGVVGNVESLLASL
jgi:hypothetical protein